MGELKTKKNTESVLDFLNAVEHPTRKADGLRLLEIMHEESGMDAHMWGSSIVGFGSYHYKYASGQEGDWLRVGFSPRKQSLSLYLMMGVEKHTDLLSQLGKHKQGKGCLYINKLEDVDEKVLRQLIRAALEEVKKYEYKK
jgi:hypothetical protein